MNQANRKRSNELAAMFFTDPYSWRKSFSVNKFGKFPSF